MSNFGKFDLKVLLTSKKVKLSMKLKSKYNKYKMTSKANKTVRAFEIKNIKNQKLNNSESTSKPLVSPETKHKLNVYSTTHFKNVTVKLGAFFNRRTQVMKANTFVALRNSMIMKNRVIDGVEYAHIEIENHYISRFIEKVKKFNNRETERQVAIVALSALLVFVTVESTFLKENAIEVYANDTLVGIVEKDPTLDAKIMIDDVINIASEEVGSDVTLYNGDINSMKIDLKPTHADAEEMVAYSDIIQSLSTVNEVKVEAYEIKINGESIGFASDLDAYNRALETYVNQFKSNKDGVEVTNIQVQDEIVLTKSPTYEYNVLTEEQMIAKFSESVVGQREHEVIAGDTIWQIAFDNGLTEQELLSLNPEVAKTGEIYPGDTVNLIKSTPRVSVTMTEVHTFTDIAYRDVEEVKNDKEYVSYKKVINEGSDGKSIFTIELKMVNGQEVKRTTLNEEILVAPVTKVIEVGTINTPAKKSSGIFITPTKGRRSDNFAARGGTHKGIDIAVPAGTPIHAADGGVVKFAGWYAAYGNLVIIDHENGYQTYYGHNSKLYVSAGDRVYQGETIAGAGSTGRSTGNHCHFEIRINGVPVNPDKYLK